MSSIEIRRVRIASGLTLEYAERGSGAPIVFLHGITDSWRSFEQMLEALPAGFRGISLTHRGHGDSDRPASGYAIEDFAADTVAFLDALGLERVALVGHSMGTLIAQEVVLSRPDRISHLVLAGGSTHFDNPVVADFHRAVMDLIDPVPRAFAHEFQAGTCYRQIEPERLARFVDETMKLTAHVWKGAIEGIVAYSSVERLSRITVPALVIAGAHDEISPSADQSRLRDGIPGAKLVTYADAGHAMHWEQPERFTEDVIGFLRAASRKAA